MLLLWTSRICRKYTNWLRTMAFAMATLLDVVGLCLSHLMISDSTLRNLFSKFSLRWLSSLSISIPTRVKDLVQFSLRSLHIWSSGSVLVMAPIGMTFVFVS